LPKGYIWCVLFGGIPVHPYIEGGGYGYMKPYIDMSLGVFLELLLQ